MKEFEILELIRRIEAFPLRREKIEEDLKNETERQGLLETVYFTLAKEMCFALEIDRNKVCDFNYEKLNSFMINKAEPLLLLKIEVLENLLEKKYST